MKQGSCLNTEQKREHPFDLTQMCEIRLTAVGGGHGKEVEGSGEKEKQLIDMDTRVVIAEGKRVGEGWRGYKEDKCNGKKCNKNDDTKNKREF